MHLTYKACIKFEVNEMSDHVVFDVTDDMGLRLASDLYALLQQFRSHCYGEWWQWQFSGIKSKM